MLKKSGFFSFETFVTKDIIKIMYILGCVSITLAGIVIATFRGNLNYILGFLIITLGNVAWRVICEGITILFSINDKLEIIKSKKK